MKYKTKQRRRAVAKWLKKLADKINVPFSDWELGKSVLIRETDIYGGIKVFTSPQVPANTVMFINPSSLRNLEEAMSGKN